jgi:hypothetical protein
MDVLATTASRRGRRIDEFVVAPGLPGAHRGQEHSDAQIVPRAQPQQALEEFLGRREGAEPPTREREPVQSAQERTIVDEAPGEHAVEALAELTPENMQAGGIHEVLLKPFSVVELGAAIRRLLDRDTTRPSG